MLSKLKIIPDTLSEILPISQIFHYQAMKRSDQYIVWAEDSEGDSVEGNDRKINQSVQGTIDYFTKKDMDENVDKIQRALSKAMISFYLNSTQYESYDDSGADYIHYEWVFEVG